jgi:hypothetical protein
VDILRAIRIDLQCRRLGARGGPVSGSFVRGGSRGPISSSGVCA